MTSSIYPIKQSLSCDPNIHYEKGIKRFRSCWLFAALQGIVVPIRMSLGYSLNVRVHFPLPLDLLDFIQFWP